MPNTPSKEHEIFMYNIAENFFRGEFPLSSLE
jgi:hypothetical protein